MKNIESKDEMKKQMLLISCVLSGAVLTYYLFKRQQKTVKEKECLSVIKP
jgi:hypothetical protein